MHSLSTLVTNDIPGTDALSIFPHSLMWQVTVFRINKRKEKGCDDDTYE